MRHPIAAAPRDERGVASVEFALIVPLLLLLLGGLADFGIAFWTKGLLASSVAEGAGYATLVGTSVTPAAIQNIVGQRLALPASSVTVTGPGCRCLYGSPVVNVVQACLVFCPDGSVPGNYVGISAQYTYTPLLPFYSQLTTPVLTEATWSRLK